MASTEPIHNQVIEGSELHPQHESWVRISNRSTMIGFLILLGLIALLVITVELHFGIGSYIALGCFLLAILLWLVWRSNPHRRSGVLENAALTAGIKADLITELGAGDVNVDSSGGVVTLRGTVPYDDFRQEAEHLARRHGAHRVINELKIDPNAPARPAPVTDGFAGVTTPEGAPEVERLRSLEEQVREALEADPRVNAYLVIVRVEEGVVYLTGRQDTVQASDAATEIVAHIPGVLGVSNDLEIMPSV